MDGAGAGHGGMGGKGENTNNGGLFYNYVTDPTEPGSNGIYEDVDNSEETIGGGVLNFDVSGTTTIDGNHYENTRMQYTAAFHGSKKEKYLDKN